MCVRGRKTEGKEKEKEEEDNPVAEQYTYITYIYTLHTTHTYIHTQAQRV